MKNCNKIIISILVMLCAVTSASADPLSVDVIPVDDTVMPDEVATYKVNLINGGTVTETLTDLHPSNGPSDFDYVFSETTGSVLPGETKQVDLTVTVPAGKPAGTYTFDVNADWNKPLGPFTISGTGNYLDVVLNVTIPEFPTVALPMLSVIGLLFVFNRRRDNS